MMLAITLTLVLGKSIGIVAAVCLAVLSGNQYCEARCLLVAAIGWVESVSRCRCSSRVKRSLTP